MLIKPITYKNYNGEEVTENVYFDLNEAEIMELELTTAGTFTQKLKRITDSKDHPEIFRLFKEIVLMAYGEKTPDGKYFLKTDPDGHKLSARFEQSMAYPVLLMELSSDADAAAKFINAIIPKGQGVEASANEKTAPAGKIVDITSTEK